jgi:hypothetical protein
MCFLRVVTYTHTHASGGARPSTLCQPRYPRSRSIGLEIYRSHSPHSTGGGGLQVFQKVDNARVRPNEASPRSRDP